jgi:hypothetical protein
LNDFDAYVEAAEEILRVFRKKVEQAAWFEL